MRRQWLRIVITSLGIEILYLVFLFTIISSRGGAYSAFGIISVFVFMLIGGFWVGLKSKSKAKAAIDGSLVGVVGLMFFYTAMTIPAMLTGNLDTSLWPLVLLSNLIKIPGGALGGYIASRLKN